jgi:hypothetical protein
MKRTLVAILALSPVMIHAQTASQAQPASTQVLQSSNVQPAVLAAIHDGAASASTPVRISTGVTAPKCIHSVSLAQELSQVPKGFAVPRQVVVAMTIDPTGTPTNLHLTKTADLITNEAVVKAVSQSRYEPAKLDGVPVAVDVRLTYDIQ